MQLTRVTRTTWLSLLAIAACSSSSSFPVDSFGSGGVGGVAPTGPDFASSSGVDPAAKEPRCPADAPKDNSGCSVPGTVCTYGPDIREDCNETYECRSGTWKHTTPNCASDCPKSFDAIKPGTACPDSQVACSYDEGTCGCFTEEIPTPPPDDDAGPDAGDGGKDGGKTYVPIPGTWKCVAPPTTVACPSARPRVLDECVKLVTCDYGSCELGRPLSYSCSARFWNEPTYAGCDP